MRIFKKFNGANGVTCPVCDTAKEVETVLVPIPGTENGNNVECKQIHKACYDVVKAMYEKEDNESVI